MWFFFALVTFLAWGSADLFYKKSAHPDEKYSHLKTSIVVGVVMGISATVTLLVLLAKGVVYNPINILLYLPVSVMYILSMTIGYFGLRYLELSVSSPIQNASGAVSCLLLILVFHELPDAISAVSIAVITLGVVLLGFFEKSREKAVLAPEDKKYSIGFVAFFMPIFYCIIDSFGTFLDGYYLSSPATTPLVDVTEEYFEDIANISYQYTFFLAAVILFVYVYIVKKEKFVARRQGFRLAAAGFETVGQIAYVFALSGNAVVAAPVIASYCVASAILARIFLKEKLSGKQYAAVALVVIGIVLLGINEGLAA